MPKVSQEHLQRRRAQIVDAATDCFARQGFHATSMQDIFRASGLSAGAVYRYFPSKNSLVRAIATEAITEVLGPLDQAISAAAGGTAADETAAAGGTAAGETTGGTPLSIAELITSLIARLGEPPLARMRPVAAQIWAEAIRDPVLAGIAREQLGHITSRLERLLAARGHGTHAETAALARLILATIQGYIVQFGIFGDVSPQSVGPAARKAFGDL